MPKRPPSIKVTITLTGWHLEEALRMALRYRITVGQLALDIVESSLLRGAVREPQ
jgi:hypothetical protein